MKEVQREAIRKQILSYIKDVYQQKQIYIIMNFQEICEKQMLVEVDGSYKKSISSQIVYIEMINSSGIILKSTLMTYSIKKILRKVKNMLSMYRKVHNSILGKYYYECVQQIPSTFYIECNKKKVFFPYRKLKKTLENINSKMEREGKVSCSIYCLQVYESNLLLNSSGSYIYTQDSKFSVRQTLQLGDLTQKLSLCGEKICKDNLYEQLYQKYKYKLDILFNGIVADSELKIQEYDYLVFDFDLFGTILHEGIGHALETEYRKDKINKVYEVGEQLLCKKVTVYDSAKKSQWVNAKYDSYGNKRKEICLMKNGRIEHGLNGIMNCISGEEWNYCDRKEKPENIAQNRMSTIEMLIEEGIYDKYYKDIISLDSTLKLTLNSNVIFFLGSKKGEYNLDNRKITIFPEMACAIADEKK